MSTSSEPAQNISYSERYVAFLDILGFSNIVRLSVVSPEQTVGLIEILESMAKLDEELGLDAEVEQDDFKGQSFSDCLVLSEAASPTGLFHLLATVTSVTLRLLGVGIFTRGGIAKGKLHHTDKVVFGPAMLEAYRLEATIARYPRVLVDERTHQDYQSTAFSKQCETYERRPRLKLSEDGPPFVDIFQLLLNAPDDWADDIEKCRSSMEAALFASIYEPNHYEKMRWLSMYWNGIAQKRGAKQVKFPLAADWEKSQA